MQGLEIEPLFLRPCAWRDTKSVELRGWDQWVLTLEVCEVRGGEFVGLAKAAVEQAIADLELHDAEIGGKSFDLQNGFCIQKG